MLAANNPDLLKKIRDAVADPQLKDDIELDIRFVQSYLTLPDTQWKGDLAGVERKVLSGVKEQLFLRDQVLATVIIKETKPITMHYSIDDAGNFLRGYTRDNQSLDLEAKADLAVSEVLNQNLQAWLASQGWSSTEGVIHSVGNSKAPVTANKFVNALEHQNTGYVKFSADNNLTPGFAIEIHDINKKEPLAQTSTSSQSG